MRPPSENFRNKASTFHSMSVGGRLVGLLKKISYSIFKRRSCVSSTFNSSSVVTVSPALSLVEMLQRGEVPVGHRRLWYESKGRRKLLASGSSLLALSSWPTLCGPEQAILAHGECVRVWKRFEREAYLEELAAIFLTMAST